MPLVAVNLTHAVLAEIKSRVDSGQYLSLENFIEVAAFNQLALEKSGSTNLNRTEDNAASNGSASKAAPSPTKKKRGAVRLTRQVYVLEKHQTNSIEPIVTPFAKIALRNSLTPAPTLPVESTEDQRIFGQVNRLLPLKLVCRWVMHNANSRSAWPPLSDIGEALADDAARLGSLLEQQDASKARKRDECLATGLPRRGNSPSKDRFFGQFVARVTRTGHAFPGAVCQYKLAVIEGERLALSRQGVDFAQIENPILDGDFQTSETAMSEDEVQFLLRHIREAVRPEQADIDTVLAAIASGSVTPPTLTAAVRDHLPADWNSGDVQTHVSGLIARMAELGIVRRRWHGRHVQYELPLTQPRARPTGEGNSHEAS